MNTFPNRLSLEESRLLTRVMTLGSGTNLPVVMSASELMKLIGVIYHDTDTSAQLDPDLWRQIAPPDTYYRIPQGWFDQAIAVGPMSHVDLLRLATGHIADFQTYLKCLSELHKRRRKYAMILAAQPIPTMVQVSPRSLVEYGQIDSEALASWLTWRKFFYDLDNRSAQETGYLFEPILASAIGGEPKSARTCVVSRAGDDSKGRQVDCWKVPVSGLPLAYEFKLRVTIAASGQGRFREETQFAEDCHSSGARPVLVVLDPTPNARLSDLQEAYRQWGGMAYVGDAAWAHLEAEAGPVMARFIETYVRTPVAEISSFEVRNGDQRSHFNLLKLEASVLGSELLLKLGNHERRISRREDASLAPSDDPDESS